MRSTRRYSKALASTIGRLVRRPGSLGLCGSGTRKEIGAAGVDRYGLNEWSSGQHWQYHSRLRDHTSLILLATRSFGRTRSWTVSLSEGHEDG